MKNRREVLIEEMNSLENQGISCQDCTGKCCTFVANSMQTTPLETIEVVNWLESNNRIDRELILKLKNCVKEFRLDQELATGKRTTFRRTYTCPFFKDQSLGCSIAPEVKPYGCLGFNALGRSVKDGENCTSNLDLLQSREEQNAKYEQLENEKLKLTLGLWWDKSPFPLALLDVMERLDKIPKA